MHGFRVDLEFYRGPLDLLFYLVRQEELDLAQIPVARIADQYVQYVELLRELNLDDIGEFLELAAMLVDMKSRYVLPHDEEHVPPLGENLDRDLVQGLLEYKRYRDAASVLEERSRAWQLRYPRLAEERYPRGVDPGVQPIHEVELWDLVSAFGRILRDSRTLQPSNIVYDETPIQVYMQRIAEALAQRNRVAFSDLFMPGMHKSAMIGMFLAVLELVRYHGLQTEQEELHGEIWLYFQQPPAGWNVPAAVDNSDRGDVPMQPSPLEPRGAGA